jgi:hypothetical protein
MVLIAVTQLRRLVAGFPPRRLGFEPGFVMDKVVLGQVFSEYSGFPDEANEYFQFT